jgi:ABC-type iron transport system FetAB permease component
MGQGPRPKITVQVTYHDLIDGLSKAGPTGAVAKLCLGQLYLEAAENVCDEAIARALATAGNNLLKGSTSGLPAG